ncbi:MAG: hypothetical protein Q8M15_16780 [Bacteroidota bacterium]|nr:hypothetical protein [Bacteroidota bacterium]
MPKYLPPLSELIPIEEIPQSLGFFQGGINTIFGQLYFDNLAVERNVNAGEGYYDITIVSYTPIALEAPGTNGMTLVLNPGFEVENSTEFPLSFSYACPILKYLPDFSFKDFDFSPKSFFNILIQIGGISNENIISGVINQYYVGEEVEDSIQDFIDAINTKYSPAPTLVKSSSTDENEIISDIVFQLTGTSNNLDISEIVFNDYILGDSIIDTILRSERLFSPSFGNFTLDNIKSLLIPQFSASLNEISLAIEFPRTILLPLDNEDNVISNEAIKSKVTFDVGSLVFNSQDGFSFEELSTISLSNSQIGKTGIKIGFTDMRLDLSRTTNIPEAIADGRPDDFVGVYVQEAYIGLPTAFLHNEGASTTSIKGKNILIGTGGFSGNIGLEDEDGLVEFTLGDFVVTFTEFDMQFHMNSITAAHVSAQLKIPIFQDSNDNDVEVAVEVFFKDNGEFTITADNIPDTIPELNCFDVFAIKLKGLSFFKRGSRYGIEVDTILNFNLEEINGAVSGLGDSLPKNLKVGMILWDDGSFEFTGAGITIDAFNLEFGPVKLNMTNISYIEELVGSYNYGVFSFNGTLDTGGTGVNVKGNGIKLYFRLSGGTDIFLRIGSIKVDIRIPGDASEEDANVLIKGYLGMGKDSNGGTEYAGGVGFSIKKAGLSGSASMRMAPDVPAFIVDIGLDFSVPIPLATTGLGIYGFRGLIGNNYHVSKEAAGLSEEDRWWLYYKSRVPNPPGTDGINTGKFTSPDGFNIGAGISLATMGDSGRAFSSKLFLMLGLPELFLIQGQAALLSQRIGLDTSEDPPFSAFMVISKKSIETGFGVNYKLPSSGFILDMQAQIEMAYFFNNSSAWYVNFGKDQPASDRIRASILGIFDGYAYLMLSAHGIKGGAGAKFEFQADYGPVSVGAGAYINMGGRISNKPVQIGGFVDLGGYAYVRVFGFGFRFDVAAMLAAEAPKPFIVIGAFSLSIGLPWPFDDIDIDVKLEWRFDDDYDTTNIPLLDTSKTLPAQATNILTYENFDLKLINDKTAAEIIDANFASLLSEIEENYVVPLDSYIDIEFAHTPLLVNNFESNSNIKIRGNTETPDYQITVPPQHGHRDQAVHQFELSKVNVKALKQTGATYEWVNYSIWDNLINGMGLGSTELSTTEEAVKALPTAYWQQVEKGSGKLNKLRILAQDMFNFLNQSSPGQYKMEYFGVDPAKIYCSKNTITETCYDWENQSIDNWYAPETLQKLDAVLSVLLHDNLGRVVESTGSYGSSPTVTLDHALQSESSKGIEIYFIKSVKTVKLKFNIPITDINDYRGTEVKVCYFKKVEDGVDGNGNVKYKYNQVSQSTDLLFVNNVDPKCYSKEYTSSGGIDKVVITAMNYFYGAAGCPAALSFAKASELGSNLGYNYFNGIIANVIMYNNGSNSSFYPIVSWPLNNTYNEDPVPGMYYINSWPSGTFDGTLIGSPNHAGTTTPNIMGYQFDNGQGIDIAAPNNDSIGEFQTERGTVPYLTNRFGFSCYIKTNNKSTDKRIIIDKRRWLRLPFATSSANAILITGYTNWIEGFTVYLKNCRLHIDICYDQINTYSYDLLDLTDNAWHQIYFDYEAGTRKLNVKIGNTFVAYNIVLPDIFGIGKTIPKSINLQKICYITVEDDLYNQIIPSSEKMEQEAKDLNNGITKTIQPIWKPDTVYAIEVSGNHKIIGGTSANHSQNFVILFQTKGTVGHFHQYLHNGNIIKQSRFKRLSDTNIPNPIKEEDFILANLKHYIDYERSYPNPNGDIGRAKPLFYHNPLISLFYIKGYAKTMFKEWTSINGLAAKQYDLIVEIINPDTNVAVGSTIDWKFQTDYFVEPNLRILNNIKQNIVEGYNCNNSFIGNLRRKSYNLEYSLTTNLLPEKLYLVDVFSKNTANNQKVKIHSFNILTSRYSDFENQINSINLDINDEAIYSTIEDDFSEEWTKLGTIIDDTVADEFKSNYPDKFERVMDYAFKRIRNLPPATATEILAFKNTSPNPDKQLLLIRNPEPFFDPRIPDSFIYDTENGCLKFRHNSVIDNNIKMIFSKDRTQAFIYNNSLNIQSQSWDVLFYNPVLTFDVASNELKYSLGDEQILSFNL